MEKFYELEELTLLPTALNSGHPKENAVFSVVDEIDKSGMQKSLPIFTSPMESIVGKETVKMYLDNGIRPVLPLSEPLSVRLEYCQWIFSAFTMKEVKENFLDQNKRGIPSQFHICIDAGNGHDQNLLSLGISLKRMYGAQVILMGGNVGCPETYSEYSKMGFDYMRVGIASGSLVDKTKYGFHWPMGSLLDAIRQFKKTAGMGLSKQVKVVADGGLSCFSDMIKALAIGADYVMVGKEFARVVEAQGTVYKCSATKSDDKRDMQRDAIDPTTIAGTEGYKAMMNGLKRYYFGNTSPETRAMRAGFADIESWKRSKQYRDDHVSDSKGTWVQIDKNIQEWVDEFKKCAYYAFMMTGTTNFIDLKKAARYGILSIQSYY